MVTVRENLKGHQYIQDTFNPVAVPDFDNHPLVSCFIFVDNNAILHRFHAVTAFLQNNDITTLP